MNIEKALPLIRLCNEGKLYDVEDWIKEGKEIQFIPIDDKKYKKVKAPLQIAVERGFYSLAELLLKSGYNPNNDKYEYLTTAATNLHLDLVKLLLKYGANVNDVCYEDVLLTNNREMMDLFIEAGLDPCTNNALAKALYYCGRPVLGFVKHYKDRFPGTQHQINLALYSAADRNKERSFALLLWLGGEPFIPVGDYIEVERDPNDEDEPLSVFDILCINARTNLTDILLKKPIPKERLDKLFYSSIDLCDPKWMQRFIKLGVDVNKDHGDGSILYRLCAHVGWKCFTYSTEQIKNHLECVEIILKAGGKLTPETCDQIKYLRRRLRDSTTERVKPLINLLIKYEAASKETLHLLTKTPKMRELLGLAEREKYKPSYQNYKYSSTSGSQSYFKRNSRYFGRS